MRRLAKSGTRVVAKPRRRSVALRRSPGIRRPARKCVTRGAPHAKRGRHPKVPAPSSVFRIALETASSRQQLGRRGVSRTGCFGFDPESAPGRCHWFLGFKSDLANWPKPLHPVLVSNRPLPLPIRSVATPACAFVAASLSAASSVESLGFPPLSFDRRCSQTVPKPRVGQAENRAFALWITGKSGSVCLANAILLRQRFPHG
ncbi:hypothetical protein SPAN111604_05795 [Sphingomonas antarctica]